MALRTFSLAFLTLLLTVTTLFPGCSERGGVNIFSVEDDVALGRQLRDTILAQPGEYPVMDRGQYPEAYDYAERIVDQILASGEIRYTDQFAWEIYLIDEEETLNAFAAPGGYLFFYTGLAKFLDHQDDFAGVIGHEMAHADLRHSTQQLTQAYGVSALLAIVLGEDQNLITDVLASLLTLKFSRDDEREADEYSVFYLCETEYAANGAAGFFEKLEGRPQPPPFLSTHPSPENRVENINATADTRGCDTTYDSDQQAWEAFQASLP